MGNLDLASPWVKWTTLYLTTRDFHPHKLVVKLRQHKVIQISSLSLTHCSKLHDKANLGKDIVHRLCSHPSIVFFPLKTWVILLVIPFNFHAQGSIPLYCDVDSLGGEPILPVSKLTLGIDLPQYLSPWPIFSSLILKCSLYYAYTSSIRSFVAYAFSCRFHILVV